MRSCAPLIVLLLPQLSVAGAIDPSGGFPQHDSIVNAQPGFWALPRSPSAEH